MVLNDTMPVLYYIDLGTFNDLYDKMNISRDQYPPAKYGAHRIGKFGLSDDVSTRLTQHKNKKSGYGRWSEEVELKWMIVLSPPQLSDAERTLSSFLKSEGFAFEYTDTNGERHDELIMFDPKHEAKVKKNYKKCSLLYPSRENDLAQTIQDNEAKHEAALLKQEFEFEKQLKAAETTTLTTQHQLELFKSKTETQLTQHQLELLTANHKIEVLELTLQLAEMKVATK